MFDLKLKEKTGGGTIVSSSSLELPKDLPSIEDSLKTLSAALVALLTPGLNQRSYSLIFKNSGLPVAM